MSEMHFHEDQSCWCPCSKRIAELEAELADGYACHVAAHALLEERAEKAEAEVERLQAERDFWRKGIEMHPWTRPGDMKRHQAAFEAMYAALKEALP